MWLDSTLFHIFLNCYNILGTKKQNYHIFTQVFLAMHDIQGVADEQFLALINTTLVTLVTTTYM